MTFNVLLTERSLQRLVLDLWGMNVTCSFIIQFQFLSHDAKHEWSMRAIFQQDQLPHFPHVPPSVAAVVWVFEEGSCPLQWETAQQRPRVESLLPLPKPASSHIPHSCLNHFWCVLCPYWGHCLMSSPINSWVLCPPHGPAASDQN